MTRQGVGVKPWADNGHLATRGHDWIQDRSVETLSSEDLTALSDAAWRRQREGLVERSPFFATKFRDAGVDFSRIESVSELRHLPFCTKAELRVAQEEHPPFGNYLGVDPDLVKLVYQTSGTSGKPCVLALTARDMETWWTIGTRSYRSAGVNPHNSVLVAFGAGPFVAGHIHGSIDRTGARRVPVAPGDTARVLSAAEAGLFDTLLGTPSFGVYLANLFQQRGIDGRRYGITHLITGGEPGGGLPSIRARMEDAFGCDVTEAMGLGDVSASLYGECMSKDGMHFCGQGFVWPELVDPTTGDPMEFVAGAVGELVYTALQRDAMPLIRFRSGDIVEIRGTACECGRTSFRMRCVARTDDMFIVRGVNVYPSAIVGVVAEFEPYVTGRARAVLSGDAVAVEPPVHIQVEVPDESSPDTQLAERISDALRSRLIFRARIEFVPQAQFGDAGYKTKLVIRT